MYEIKIVARFYHEAPADPDFRDTLQRVYDAVSDMEEAIGKRDGETEVTEVDYYGDDGESALWSQKHEEMLRLLGGVTEDDWIDRLLSEDCDENLVTAIIEEALRRRQL